MYVSVDGQVWIQHKFVCLTAAVTFTQSHLYSLIFFFYKLTWCCVSPNNGYCHVHSLYVQRL